MFLECVCLERFQVEKVIMHKESVAGDARRRDYFLKFKGLDISQVCPLLVLNFFFWYPPPGIFWATSREYSHCLAGYWSQLENILTVWHSIGRS